MDPVFEFPLRLPARGSRELLRELHGQLRAAILDGRLAPGLQLPSTRAFAAAYGVSRNTAVACYDLLLSEGYLRTRRGAGAYVADARPQWRRRRTGVDPARETRLAPAWRNVPAPAARAAPARLDFRLGVPDPTEFPYAIWRRLSARALRALSRQAAGYAPAAGRPALRAAIARHVAFARAVACRAEDVIVTAGAQQAFDLLARILVAPGRSVVAVENPGYPPLRAALAAAGAKLAPVPVDAEGLVVARIPDHARVVCVTPSHQFPLGCALSTRRRAELLEFAQTHNAVVIEDDYDGEFRYGSRPLDALQTLDRAESVFYVGTFSKSLFPALRLGYIVAPSWAQAALAAAKQAADGHCETLGQDTLAAFIDEGHLARHVRRMRRLYAERHALLETRLTQDLGEWLERLPAAAGLHLSALARPGVDVDALVRRSGDAGLALEALRPYYHGRAGRAGLAFGFGARSLHDLDAGLDLLQRLLAR